MEDLQGYITNISGLLSIGLLACMVFIWRSKQLGITQYLLYTLSVICIAISFNTGLLSGTLADELNLGGNILPELSVIILSILTILYTMWKSADDKKRKQKPLSLGTDYSF